MRVLSCLFLLTSLSCQKVWQDKSQYAELLMIDTVGNSFLSKTKEIYLKHVLLKRKSLGKKNIVVRGAVNSVGMYQTYLTIDDTTGQLLILLSHLSDFKYIPKVGEEIAVIGSLTNGHKGYPVLKAKHMIPSPAKTEG